ncbi:hypothetical protein SCA6_018574 [Theobroma cacao]
MDSIEIMGQVAICNTILQTISEKAEKHIHEMMVGKLSAHKWKRKLLEKGAFMGKVKVESDMTIYWQKRNGK